MDLLHVFTVTWNEEKIIQDLIDWYRERVPNCLITIYDNESTDSTVEIAKQNGCEVISFTTSNTMDEITLMDIRNNCWKKSTAQYIIVCDADEWVDVNRDVLLRNNEEKEWNICKCMGYEIFGNGEPMNELVYGTWSAGYCKPVLFKRTEIEDSGFEAGSHKSVPKSKSGFFIKQKNNFPNLFHTKHRSWEGMLERCKLLAERRSEDSKKRGWNFHYSLPESAHADYRNNGIKNAIKIR